FKRDQNDLRISTNTQRRPPGSCAVVGKNLKLTHARQTMNEFPPNAAGDPRIRKELTAVRVSGELQRDAFGFGHVQGHRRMQQEHAGSLAIDVGVAENLTITLGMSCIAIMHADYLKPVDVNLLIV